MHAPMYLPYRIHHKLLLYIPSKYKSSLPKLVQMKQEVQLEKMRKSWKMTESFSITWSFCYAFYALLRGIICKYFFVCTSDTHLNLLIIIRNVMRACLVYKEHIYFSGMKDDSKASKPIHVIHYLNRFCT